ncbi:group II intron maturase-specific domain-containing protein, partial [Bacillus rubiinfantis]|uniref:group II intron maturase-specific domain-containing protein n=1 Tax=Bacillus rubiinfantis TaxID=1499680 RepID=UPI0024824167
RIGETSVELLEKILSNQNMNEAYLRVYKNKGASGVDGVTVEELKQYLRETKDELRQRIRTKPHPKSVQKFQRKLRQLTKRNWSVSLDTRILKLKQVIFGWVNYFRIANMKTVMSRIDEKLRSRIRVIIWKQWKVPRKQIKSLIQLGIPEEEAKGLTFCRKGYRYIGLSKVVQRAISNKRLKQRGVPSALERYLIVHTHCNIN